MIGELTGDFFDTSDFLSVLSEIFSSCSRFLSALLLALERGQSLA